MLLDIVNGQKLTQTKLNCVSCVYKFAWSVCLVEETIGDISEFRSSEGVNDI